VSPPGQGVLRGDSSEYALPQTSIWGSHQSALGVLHDGFGMDLLELVAVQGAYDPAVGGVAGGLISLGGRVSGEVGGTCT
jgi:hypothetical protein